MNHSQSEVKRVPNWIMLLLAISCGLIVANLYYAQPLVGPISEATGLSPGAAGLIVTLTQIGYVLGLLFIVPLSDLIENRRLAVSALIVVVCALIAAALATNATIFLAASLFIGLGSVTAQILVPYAAYLASEEQRGRVVGNVMSGLLLGIMFARPAASFLADLFGWKVIFWLSAGIIALLTLLLSRALPERKPAPTLKYAQLIGSLGALWRGTPVLRRRAFYQAFLFGSFSLFWTVVPMRLSGYFHLSQQGIALFALAGVAGAVAAPIAGRLADRGWTRMLTGLAITIAAASFLLSYLVRGNSAVSLALLLLAAIVLDMGVSGNLVLGQRAIYSLGSESRGRLNGLFMAIFFVGGALGSFLGGWSYAYGGWSSAALLGLLMPVLALLYFFTEHKQSAAALVNHGGGTVAEK
ncbi:MFS transporter [Paenibacillus sabinae]|uniref:Permease of the major facilitator superfamily protein n=1 Tax=Paenibacillus sabinae T27 TaxID=1268072 RepID=X4ZUQ3_9BACL|nr:MFS transporter [Paenibacillus sabinae]AHV96058.1 Permease of the major facilitator superfamily protein [Paenibacillus sabinae T27]